MVPQRTLLAMLAVASSIFFPRGASAQDASDWARDSHSAVRLLAGSRSGAVLLGGIEVELQDDWKTYWRTPGDSGVPPRFDFSKSDNIDTVTPLFPAPMKFADGAGGTSYGYKKHFILPLRIVAKDGGKPITLRLVFSYAVCDKLCIPAVASLELGFASAASTMDAELRDALNTVPKPMKIGDAAPTGISGVTRDGRHVYVDVIRPSAARINLFVEGPTDQWALPDPKPTEHSPAGTTRFAFDLDGLPPDARPEGATLKFTLVAPDTALEYNVTLN